MALTTDAPRMTTSTRAIRPPRNRNTIRTGFGMNPSCSEWKSAHFAVEARARQALYDDSAREDSEPCIRPCDVAESGHAKLGIPFQAGADPRASATVFLAEQLVGDPAVERELL